MYDPTFLAKATRRKTLSTNPLLPCRVCLFRQKLGAGKLKTQTNKTPRVDLSSAGGRVQRLSARRKADFEIPRTRNSMQPTPKKPPGSTIFSRGGHDVSQVRVRGRRAAATTENNIPRDWHPVLFPTLLFILSSSPQLPSAEAIVLWVKGDSWKPLVCDCTQAASQRTSS